MKYSAIIARIGELDDAGEILGDKVDLPSEPVLVSQNFDKDVPPLGTAVVTRIGNDIHAVLDIDLIPEIASQLYAVVGGNVKGRVKDGTVTHWSINHVAVTAHPADKGLQKLREYPHCRPEEIKFQLTVDPIDRPLVDGDDDN